MQQPAVEAFWTTPGVQQAHRLLTKGIQLDYERELATIKRLTGDTFRPNFSYVPIAAGRLAIGSAVVEPNLGPVRAACNTIQADFVLLSWRDDYGTSQAAARYNPGTVFAQRVPGERDAFLIRQHVDRFNRNGKDIPAAVARLIAIHVHPGAKSGLYRFAIDGAFRDGRLYDELDQLATNRPSHMPWIQAMGRFCVNQQSAGPNPQWVKEARSATLSNTKSRYATTRPAEPAEPFTRKTVSTEVASQLMDAAFHIGVLASSSKLFKHPSAYTRDVMRKNPMWRALAREHPELKQEWV